MTDFEVSEILKNEFHDYIAHEYYGYKLLISLKNPLEYENKDLKQIVSKLRQYIKFIPDLSKLCTDEVCIAVLKPYLQSEHYYFNKFTGTVYADISEVSYEQRCDFFNQTGYLLRAQAKPLSKTKQQLSKIYISNLHKIVSFKKEVGKILNNKVKMNENSEYTLFSCLGGASEIGRSCYLLKTNLSSIMIDCGYKLGKPYEYPYLNFKDFNINDLSAVIITHSHGDHSGILPALYSIGYTGPVYMTEPTQALTAILNLDTFKIQGTEIENTIYSLADVKEWILKTIILPIKKTIKIASDIHMTCYQSNHILGGVMLKFRINKQNILFTSDFKYLPSFSMLNQIPPTEILKSDVLICEGTNVGKKEDNDSLVAFKQQLLNIFTDVAARSSFVLFPVIAAGRSEEVLYVVNEVLSENNLDLTVYIEKSVLETLYLHLDYPYFLKRDVYAKLKTILSKPNVQLITNRADIYDKFGIIISPSGMLEGGPSVEHFMKLCESSDNHIFFTCYQAINSLGRQILESKEYVFLTYKGSPLSLKLNINIHKTGALSGHTSHTNIVKFIKSQNAKTNILIHCNLNQVLKVYNSLNLEILIPQNLETIRL